MGQIVQHCLDELLRNGTLLIAAKPDVRRACLEITSRCTLNCAMPMHVGRAWQGEPSRGAHMSSGVLAHLCVARSPSLLFARSIIFGER